MSNSLRNAIELVSHAPANLRPVTRVAGRLFLVHLEENAFLPKSFAAGQPEELKSLAHALIDELDFNYENVFQCLLDALESTFVAYDPLYYGHNVHGVTAERGYFVRSLAASFKRVTGEWRKSWVATAARVALMPTDSVDNNPQFTYKNVGYMIGDLDPDQSLTRLEQAILHMPGRRSRG